MSEFVNKVKAKDGTEYGMRDDRIPEILAENEGKILKVENGAIVFSDLPEAKPNLEYKYRHDLLLTFYTPAEINAIRNYFQEHQEELMLEMYQPICDYLGIDMETFMNEGSSIFINIFKTKEGRDLYYKLIEDVIAAGGGCYDVWNALYDTLRSLASIYTDFSSTSDGYSFEWALGSLYPYSIRAALLSNDSAQLTFDTLKTFNSDNCKFIAAADQEGDRFNMNGFDDFVASLDEETLNHLGSALIILPTYEKMKIKFKIDDIKEVIGSGLALTLMTYTAELFGSGCLPHSSYVYYNQLKDVEDLKITDLETNEVLREVEREPRVYEGSDTSYSPRVPTKR